MVDALRHFHHIDRKLDIHIAFNPPPPLRIGVFFQRLGDHGKAIIVKPIDQRPQGRELLLLGQRGIIKRAHQEALAGKQLQQTLIIDIELQAFGGPIEVGAVYENRNLLLRIKKHLWPPFKSLDHSTRP